MRRRLLAIAVLLVTALGSGVSGATLTSFGSRGAWQSAAAAVGRDTLFEDFNSFMSDVPYGGTPVVAGFLTLANAVGNGDTAFLIDAGDVALPAAVPSVNGTTFATTVAAGSLKTVLSFTPIVALGFDFGASSAGGTIVLETSNGETTAFSNFSGGGFFGFISADPFTSVAWDRVGPSNTFAGIDNVEALTPVPLPGAFVLLASGVLVLAARRRSR